MQTIQDWQDLIGAIIGASAAFVLWWVAEKYQRFNKRQEDLSYLNRAIVDQINNLLEIKRTITSFANGSIESMIIKTKKDEKNQYTIDLAFFPLFSARPLGEEFQKKSTGSGFLDNKLLRVFALSQDLPHIIDDLRRQFEKTLDLNKEMVFNKLNGPELQRNIYLKNISDYQIVLKKQMIENNLPIFLKILTEALIGLEELRNMGLIKWKLKFNLQYRLYLKRSAYLLVKNKTSENIEQYLKPKIDQKILEIQRIEQGLS